MPRWTTLRTLENEAAYKNYQDVSMCCSVVFITRPNKTCVICQAPHPQIERWLRCSSKTCASFRDPALDVSRKKAPQTQAAKKRAERMNACPLRWKVFECSRTGKYQVVVNSQPHSRDGLKCEGSHLPRVTEDMKKFVAKQDDNGIPPRVILANLMEQEDIPRPRRGWLNDSQLTNVLKHHRRSEGVKNSIESTVEYTKLHPYKPDIAIDEPCFFGASVDEQGFPYVGSGDDYDPFMMGITSVATIDSCIKFMESGGYTIFHADATFKLSDIGYPVITCGFTDRSRAYQLAAVFVVSHRRASDYAQCFSALARLFKEVRGKTIRVDAVMGDAEDAQANGIAMVSELSGAQLLMCFFHVLYNVRKKIRHMSLFMRKTVMTGIMDMHFSKDVDEFRVLRARALSSWRSTRGLREFATYFETQWLSGRFWRWQAFHTPTGCATTNNPCEVLNSSLKRFFQRRRWHMKMLLQKLRSFVAVTPNVEPVSENYIAVPKSDVIDAAGFLVVGGRVSVERAIAEPGSDEEDRFEEGQFWVRVRHLDDSDSQTTEGDDDDQGFREAFDGVVELDDDEEPGDDSEDARDVPLLVAREHWHQDLQHERDREKAAKLYDGAVHWALKRSHRSGMPPLGWLVNTKECTCECKYYMKFTTCAHIVVARMSSRMRTPGEAVVRKFRSRILGKIAKVRGKAVSAKKISGKKSSRKTCTDQSNATLVGHDATIPIRAIPSGTTPIRAITSGSIISSVITSAAAAPSHSFGAWSGSDSSNHLLSMSLPSDQGAAYHSAPMTQGSSTGQDSSNYSAAAYRPYLSQHDDTAPHLGYHDAAPSINRFAGVIAPVLPTVPAPTSTAECSAWRLPLRGRPPHASSALDIQFVMDY